MPAKRLIEIMSFAQEFNDQAPPEGFLHAWFSYKQAERTGSIWYRHQNGREVEVTTVLGSAGRLSWDDAVYLGLVLDKDGFVRDGQKPSTQGEPLSLPTVDGRLRALGRRWMSRQWYRRRLGVKR